ncbi:MAG: hypothetical protein KatS3mg087_1095 [Patescibacteria group bacterium]|nr:MAG: hypothetical protein KatS3mg087_1095 [Patescibacteria group bacterium]
MKTINIENIGPIKKLAIPLPDAGVVVLRGRNGVGKSHALAAVDALVSGRGRPPCRDGAQQGVVDGVGARLTIGRSARRTGEAEVITLEGRLDISQLVQPPIKDEEAADRQRIKALIQLSGKSANVEDFELILPPGINVYDLIDAEDAKDDPVVVAGRIKRALEAEARRWEKVAEEHNAEAFVLAKQVHEKPSVDGVLWAQVQHQPSVVRAQAEMKLAGAIAKLREIEAKQEMAAKHAAQVENAKKALAELQSLESVSPDKIDAEILDLDQKIRELQEAIAAAHEKKKQLIKQREQAAVIHQQIEELRRVISEGVEMISQDQIIAARIAVDEARYWCEEVNLAIEKAALECRITRAKEEADKASGRAQEFRDSALAVDSVLSALVSRVTKRLRVESGRLVCDTDRGVEPFSELSPGERWRIALEIAAEQVGQGGLVTVPQEAWEALDPVHRSEISVIAKQVGVVILTAEADEHENIHVDFVS